MTRLKLPVYAERLVALALLAIALVIAIIFFERLPIENTSLGLDWRAIWTDIQGGQLHYGGVRYPPWSMLAVMPLGLLSFRASWGVLMLLTLLVELISVPQIPNKPLQYVAMVLLATSYLSLRHIADGNLEGFVIAGILLLLYGFTQGNFWLLLAGLLLAPIKTQETWILLLATGYYLVTTWPRRRWLALGGLLALVAIPTLLWKGQEWFLSMSTSPFRNSIMDSSLLAALYRLGWPGWASAIVWVSIAAVTVWVMAATPKTLSREKAGLLITAGLILSPYSAGNSVLTVLAIGIVPLLFKRPLIGFGLFLLVDLPFFFPASFAYNFSAFYWTAILLIVFGVLIWSVKTTDQPQSVPGITQPVAP